MSRDINSSDIFDDDELTLGSAWGKDSTSTESEAPFKICLNLLGDDDYSSPLSMALDHSNADWRNDQRQSSQSLEENLSAFTDEQIYKINNVNEKLRFLLSFENLNHEARKTVVSQTISSSKNKALDKPLRDKDIEFATKMFYRQGALMQKTLEPIKMSRLMSIPESKRKFHVKKSDMEDIERKKALKAITIEKVKEFGLKKGVSSTPNPSKKKFQDKYQTIEQILTEVATSIEEQRVAKKVNQTMEKERKQTQKDLNASVEKYYNQMQQIHEDVLKMIHQEINYRNMVLHSRNVKKIDFKKKAKNSSEDMKKILGISNLFNMMPNLGYQVDESERSQASLDASFSKDFERQKC